MGNKLGRRRQAVDEKYTRPQGLYPIKDVDYKKLRKLILESKLAPCYPGGDECDCGLLEECPICFLSKGELNVRNFIDGASLMPDVYYPTLNRSRCCTKSICTECFLQMKNPNSARPTQCPFCKTPNYAVEYRGVKSKEERGLEQIEEQKVLEAKIRIRQQEVQEEEERMHKRQETSSSNAITQTESVECGTSVVVEGEAVVSSQDLNAAPVYSAPQNLQENQTDVLDMDLEDIMVMEAIWLSIQENGRQRDPSYNTAMPEQYSSSPLPHSPPGGPTCTTGSLAGHQQVGGEQPCNFSGPTSGPDIPPRSSGGSSRRKKTKRSYAPETTSDDIQPKNTTMMSFAGPSYSGGEILLPPPPPIYAACMAYNTQFETDQRFISFLPPPLPPAYYEGGGFPSLHESFNGQMMMAAGTSAQGLSWH